MGRCAGPESLGSHAGEPLPGDVQGRAVQARLGYELGFQAQCELAVAGPDLRDGPLEQLDSLSEAAGEDQRAAEEQCQLGAASSIAGTCERLLEASDRGGGIHVELGGAQLGEPSPRWSSVGGSASARRR